MLIICEGFLVFLKRLNASKRKQQDIRSGIMKTICMINKILFAFSDRLGYCSDVKTAAIKFKPKPTMNITLLD